ncbi:MAG: amidase domain-containing protein [Anaerolineales bacterium]
MAAQANPTLNNEQKIKAAIDAYFMLRYEGQKTLNAKGYLPLVSTRNDARKWLQKEQDKQEIEIFQGKTVGLNYLTYKYKLNYQNIKIVDNTANVVLFENNEVVYSVSAPVVTKLANLKHVISLVLTSNSWKITDDNYRDELTQLMQYNSKAEIEQSIRNEYEANLKSQHILQPNLPQATTYNRTNAVNYAQKYWSYPGNSSQYLPMYISIGYKGDCTNFASQVVKAGGGALDTSGSKKWFYSAGTVADNFNVWSTYNDDTYSSSWTVVGDLYTYLMDTTADTPGPTGYLFSPTNLCNMGGGDVVQLSADGGSSYFHTVVIVNVGSGCTTDGNSVYINSHDTDRQNYPLVGYSGYTKRLIAIFVP